MTKILFINPPLTQKERYGVKQKAGGQTPPTGLVLLATIMKNKGYDVELIDMCVENKIIPKCDYLCITSSTLAIYHAKDVAEIAKHFYPNVKIILGGAHITAVPIETIERLGKFFDYAVLGEGDETLPELIDCLEKNGNVSEVKGICFTKGDSMLTFTTPRPMYQNLDNLPIPDWNLLPDLAKNYSPPAHTVKKFPAALLVCSRGCFGQCTFCDKKVFGSRIRSYSSDYIFNMIMDLKNNYGIKEIQFRDDNLLIFKNTVKELCNRLINEKINLTFSCTARVDIVDEKYLKLLKKAGCYQIWYGIESGSDRILKVIKKNTTVEQIRKAITLTKKCGISPCGFFIIGHPTETEDDIKATIKLILELPLDEFHWGHMTPFPGCELYKTALQYGSFNNDWKKMNGWNVLFITKELTHDKLVYYCNLAFRKFYFRPRIIFNYMLKLRSWHNIKVYFTALIGLLMLTSMKKRD